MKIKHIALLIAVMSVLASCQSNQPVPQFVGEGHAEFIKSLLAK